MDLAIIIVSWNVRQLLRSCLTSVYQSLYASSLERRPLSAEVWVVDNNSADGTREMVRERFPQARLIANGENRGFAGGNNQALERALKERPRFALLLNPDTAVRGRALETLVRFMEGTTQAGMSGARLVFGDGSFQHSAFRFPGLAQILLDLFPLPGPLHDTRLNGRYPRGWYAPGAPPFRVDHPLGAAMLIRREAIEDVGLMDTGFYLYCEEIDWAMRMWASGWEVYCVPGAEIVHYGGQSTSQIRAQSFANLWRSRHRLYTKHYSPLRVRLAAQLVRAGMKRQARQTDSAELQAACREIGQLWATR
jgi:N-acetylglucosaminyl-diphospho-decaprenol L-rhamnosyltransferase